MTPTNPRTMLLITLACASGTVCGARGTLKADGIFKVKGADMATAMITVVPQGAPAFMLPAGVRTFVLDLPLNEEYLVSFDRVGCPSKQVYFDTRVPLEMHASEFSFPFMVTLEHLDAEDLFAYEGPVGFVRYQHPIRDFGYETQYVVNVDEAMRDRLDEMKVSGIDPKRPPSYVSAVVVDRPRGATGIQEAPDQSGTLAQNVREVPRLVHVIEREVSSVRVEPEDLSRLDIRNATLVREEPVAKFWSSPSAVRAIVAGTKARIAESTLPKRAPQAASPSAAQMVGAPQVKFVSVGGALQREEQFISEERRVVHVVRFIGADGPVEELRKVTHAYGGVFYFDNDRSITRREFDDRSATR